MIDSGFFDLDRTIIDENGRAYDGVCEAFDARPGFTKTILTARGFPRFREAISDNPSLAVTAGMPVALENGGRIIDSETYDSIYYQPLSVDEQTSICDYIEGSEGVRYVAFHSQEVQAKTMLWSPDRDEAEWLHGAYSHNAEVFVCSKEELYQVIKRSNPCMVTCRMFENGPQILPGVAFYSRDTTINFLPAGVNKGVAAEIIASMRGIRLDRTMAAGNDYNDEPMLIIEGLGYPVVVGDEMDEDVRSRLPEHTIYIPDPRRLGSFILERTQK